jgi:dipeptidyl-peptidase-4
MLLPHQWKHLVRGGAVIPNWAGGSDWFSYATTTSTGTEHIHVDPERRRREPLFDLDAITRQVSTRLREPVDTRSAMCDVSIHADDVVGFSYAGRRWKYRRGTKTVEPFDEPAIAPGDSVSPDWRWSVRVEQDNLVLRDRADSVERPLTESGVDADSIGTVPDSSRRLILARHGLQMPPAVVWSPDSRHILTHRIDQRALPSMHYIQSSPDDDALPRLFSQRFTSPGAPSVATATLMTIAVETGEIARADATPIPCPVASPILAGLAWWNRAGTRVFFIWSGRGDRDVKLCTLDPSDGAVEVILSETSNTQIQLHPIHGMNPNIHVLATGEILWWSERTGWGHLYLYAPDGDLRPLTSGSWLVRDLVAVDEEARVAVVSASGKEDGLDPYVRQLYRLELDTGSIERITDDELDHDATGSPSGRFVVDVASWVDEPPRSVVLTAEGEVAVELESADVERLHATGWRPPERFVTKAADGHTDLYGLLFRPHGFDESGRFPVLDDIYPGPSAIAASVQFCARGHAEHAATMAALGFAVIVVDGRGSPLRGKVFQEHCRGARRDDNIDDHVAAIRALGATRPWLDLDRVGIYGRSGGGRAAARAMLRHPSFFKVGVSAAGNHDDRIYNARWGEKYVGFPYEVDYGDHANTAHAENLRGKLLLVHGELDDNVSPTATLRLVNALIDSNKDFDLLIVPNADHTLIERQAYWLRRRWDYFVHQLMKIEPPAYRIMDIPLELERLLEGIGR